MLAVCQPCSDFAGYVWSPCHAVLPSTLCYFIGNAVVVRFVVHSNEKCY
jgi:hypothetical protein